MRTAVRIACIAIPLWVIWAALIWASKPQPPTGAAQAVFVGSSIVALVSCCKACWDLLPAYEGRAWRRFANIGIGVLVFFAVAFTGHLIGLAVAA